MDLPRAYQEFDKQLRAYNQAINIYSSKSYDQLAFHIQDSIILSGLIPKTSKKVLDFGSGSGLPSVILANERPDLNVVAIESKAKKRTFIIKMKELYCLNNLIVFEGDIQQYLSTFPKKIECLTAKAFASLDKIYSILKRSNKSCNYIFIPISYNQSQTVYKHLSDQIIIKKIQNVNFYYLAIFNKS